MKVVKPTKKSLSSCGPPLEAYVDCLEASCEVSKRFRNLQKHCDTRHGYFMQLVCLVGDCTWYCGSQRLDCFQKHALVIHNQNIDGYIRRFVPDNCFGAGYAVGSKEQ